MPGTPYAGNDVFPASITIPTDGDDYVAATYAPADEGNADRTRWLKNRAGDYRVVGVPNVYDVVYDDVLGFTNTSWADTVLTPAHATTLTTVPAAALLVDDWLDVIFAGTGSFTPGSASALNQGWLALVRNGALISGANALYAPGAINSNIIIFTAPIVLKAKIHVTAAVDQVFGITGKIDHSATQVEFRGSWSISITHYRSNA
jgi:hypothetical protein